MIIFRLKKYSSDQILNTKGFDKNRKYDTDLNRLGNIKKENTTLSDLQKELRSTSLTKELQKAKKDLNNN